MKAPILLAAILLSGCIHRAPKPATCCCVWGHHDRNEASFCSPEDCDLHGDEMFELEKEGE